MLRVVVLILCFEAVCFASNYEVGPGRNLDSIAQVPWAKLAPGDIVSIHWRAEPYRVKWIICAKGTETAPVIVRGVPNSKGQLPVISGENATTPPGLDYWGHQRSIIKVGGASVHRGIVPAWVVIENLEVKDARPPYTFTQRKNRPGRYAALAAPLWIESGNHITVRNCILHNGGNGLFVSKAAKNILVERCHIFDNGYEKSGAVHNIYAAATDLTFRFNRLGPLRPGCLGNNLRDRSAGTVIAYNWIEGGNRELDLVDAEDSADIRNNPAYRSTFVYGNVLLEPDGPGAQIVHYGGDSGHTNWYRKGTLYFYNNTVISRRTNNTTLFRIQTAEEKVDCRNNIIFWTAPGKYLSIVDSVGQVKLENNWLKSGWVKCHEELKGTVTAQRNLNGKLPGFVDQDRNDFSLAPGSPCINAAGTLLPDVLPGYKPSDEYLVHASGSKRDSLSDLGAFSFKKR